MKLDISSKLDQVGDTFTGKEKGCDMSKVLIGVFSGIFIGAVIYELLNRTNPDFMRKMEDLASRKVDDICDVHPQVVA